MGRSITRTSKRSLDKTAYHEAGHAVVGWAVGRRLKKVTIIPTRETVGCTYHYRLLHFRPDADNYIPNGTAYARTFTKSVHEASIFLGGMEAERKFCGRYNYQQASSDVGRAWDLCNYFSGDEYGPEFKAMYQWLRLKTRNIVENHWVCVEALAKQLVESMTMKGADAEELIRVASYNRAF